MVRNQRGFTGLEIAGVAALIGLLFFAVGPKLNLFDNSADPANRRTAETLSGRDIVSITKAVSEVEGPVTVSVDRSVEASKEVTDPKLTAGQRIGRFFSGLGLWALLGLGLLLLTPLGAVLWKLYTYRSAFKNTVAGIRDIDDKDVYEKATRCIAVSQNKRDKRLVDRMKAELH
jgi:hypothetical protein